MLATAWTAIGGLVDVMVLRRWQIGKLWPEEKAGHITATAVPERNTHEIEKFGGSERNRAEEPEIKVALYGHRRDSGRHPPCHDRILVDASPCDGVVGSLGYGVCKCR